MLSLKLGIAMLLSYSLALCALSITKLDNDAPSFRMFLLGMIGINYCIFMMRIAIRRGVFK
jgi:hypothetical protein